MSAGSASRGDAPSRRATRDVVDEQAALLRVAELVARGGPLEELFGVVTDEAAKLLDGTAVTLTRFIGEMELVVLATHGGPAAVGTRIAYEPDALPDRVRRAGAVVRVDDYTEQPDVRLAAHYGLAAAVSVPVAVSGVVWGMFTATSPATALAAGTEDRLVQFVRLVAAALANIQARADLLAMADQQSALRSVAELAAQAVPAEQVLDAIAQQAARLAGVDFTLLLRYEPDGSSEIVAYDGAPTGFAVGMHASAEGDGSVHRVWRTRRAARVDDLAAAKGRWPEMAARQGYSTSAGVPILIQGELWGAIIVVGRAGTLPVTIPKQLTDFAEITATAIAAAQSRRQLRALADEQAALRRVAEEVARGADLGVVFSTVAHEASRLLGAPATALLRFDPDDVAVVVAAHDSPADLGLRVPSHPGTPVGHVRTSGGPVRVDSFAGTPLAALAAELGVAAGVAVPVVVEGRVWGTLTTSTPGAPAPAGTEERLLPFAELAAAAIANAENRAKLTASRARVIATADETRRRVLRDVHDGAQQRLVHAILALKAARDELASGRSAAALVTEALTNAELANRELRDVVRGILPVSLTSGGLGPGLGSLVADLPLPVDLHVSVPRLGPQLETTAYFIVTEALTNAVKHAHATRARVVLALESDELTIEVADDGVGGADPALGTGLTGLLDRVEAGEGTFDLTSPLGSGTTLRVTLPTAPPALR